LIIGSKKNESKKKNIPTLGAKSLSTHTKKTRGEEKNKKII
jgi:hypothetical protein